MKGLPGNVLPFGAVTVCDCARLERMAHGLADAELAAVGCVGDDERADEGAWATVIATRPTTTAQTRRCMMKQWNMCRCGSRAVCYCG